MQENQKDIILFDGICNFCNHSVNFIIKNDNKNKFYFASLQSDFANQMLLGKSIPNDLDSIILIKDNDIYIKSTAVLKICKELKGLYKLLYMFIIIPTPIRDFLYQLIAKNRYKLFGKKDVCMIPSKEVRSKFL